MRFPSAPTARRDGLGSVLDETEPSDRPLRPLRPLRYAESGPCGRPRALCRMRSACRDLPRRVRLDPARATAPALQPRPETRPRVLVVQELVGFFTVHRHGLVHEDVDRRHGEGVVVGRVGGGHCRGRRAHDRLARPSAVCGTGPRAEVRMYGLGLAVRSILFVGLRVPVFARVCDLESATDIVSLVT